MIHLIIIVMFSNFSYVKNITDISVDDLFDHCMLANHSVTVWTKDIYQNINYIMKSYLIFSIFALTSDVQHP